MALAALIRQTPGRYAVSGELSFATVTGLLSESRTQFAGESNIEVDLSAVTHADSAGLSLLVEWLRQAKLQGGQLRYLALPEQLRALAKISDIAGLFGQSA